MCGVKHSDPQKRTERNNGRTWWSLFYSLGSIKESAWRCFLWGLRTDWAQTFPHLSADGHNETILLSITRHSLFVAGLMRLCMIISRLETIFHSFSVMYVNPLSTHTRANTAALIRFHKASRLSTNLLWLLKLHHNTTSKNCGTVDWNRSSFRLSPDSEMQQSEHVEQRQTSGRGSLTTQTAWQTGGRYWIWSSFIYSADKIWQRANLKKTLRLCSRRKKTSFKITIHLSLMQKTKNPGLEYNRFFLPNKTFLDSRH